MTVLLEIRDRLTLFYSQAESFILPILKFILCFVCLSQINSSLGFMYIITSPTITLVVSLLCSFLPANMMIVFSAGFIILHLYKLSLECVIVALVVFILMFLLYFRFSPKDSLVVLLTPMCFALKIPYVIPLVAGFLGTPLSAISVGCGVVVYYVINYFSSNASMLSNLDLESMVAKFKFVVDALLSNKTMMVMVAVFAVTVVLVYVVKQLSVDYSWKIALGVGTIACAVMTIMGNMIMDLNISIVSVVVGIIVSTLIVMVLQFFVFCVDYSRTENVQFEDDEYYYYVKAVPKISVPSSEKKITHISDESKAEIRNRKVKQRVERTEVIDEDDVRVVRKNRLE